MLSIFLFLNIETNLLYTNLVKPNNNSSMLIANDIFHVTIHVKQLRLYIHYVGVLVQAAITK